MSCSKGHHCCQNLKPKNAMPEMVSIVDIKNENPFVKTFTLDCSVDGQPGQFVMLWLPRVDEKPFSIAYDDGQNLELSIANVGTFTEQLFTKKPGDKVGIRGSYGKTFQYEDGEHLVVLGGGYGAAPLYFLAVEAVVRGCTVEFIIGARSAEYLMFEEKAMQLKAVKVHVATNDGSRGFTGTSVDLLNHLLNEGMKVDRIMTVGPEMMMKAVSDVALVRDIACQVSLERYMKCGFGICGQCVVDESGMAVCMNGPVMDHKLARAQAEFGKYHRDKVGRKKEW
ncbi:MAG: dihydroorotate dehydrogenase electron transfer subunit, dihydroorotate dehydrogenase electron transfer subunit [Candidatus Peregrinibacteria bacterium GW2011_GWE2_39_6]|nr:MAG: dihydroorotate dehydrogenase electron transfer subunit, dihydroorotate dehydrogenase electron transfer subunit [Candidatus Peregrinibacteria bacterium GW2011_GWF2_39_17]KKR24582.1 MAG: dihydroorotate dehydrogenase electron transfer subunit, dihydroorotate dehydrogenase electron transfer subunit [Candidatus Peregrinibacteria bacterium GW2011_GWE2_39_6]HCW32687.1 dihydroorotate dehydrogenase electron transfer subunit [Candidatus Peregrinibacteria bacterium]